VRVRRRHNQSDSAILNWLASFVTNRRKVVFWGTLVVIGVLTAGSLQIELQDDWVKYFDKSFHIRQATDFAEDNLTGFHTIEYSLNSGETGGISNPEYLAKVEEFANWFRQQAKVVNVNAITETMKRLNKNMHGNDNSYYRIPEQRDLAAQYLLLYEMSLPFGLDLNNYIDVDKSATRMKVILRGTTTKELREMEAKGNEWLKANAPADMVTVASGLSVIWAHLSARNINSMLGGSFWALLLISGIMMLALRSIKLGLVSLIPNLAPAFMAFGIWGLLVGEAGLGITIIAAMTLGIVVDDTVHFISKYLRARREHSMDPTEAIRYSFNTVGKALWVTSLALVSGFMVLTLSGFRMNSDMGLMAAITITLALSLDFLFLPAILMKVDGKSAKLVIRRKEKTDETIAYETVETLDSDVDSVPHAA
jgi:predicted RND superfamily exporter protein